MDVLEALDHEMMEGGRLCGAPTRMAVLLTMGRNIAEDGGGRGGIDCSCQGGEGRGD